MIIELVLMNVLGVIFIYFGFLIWKKEKISLIHSYHYKKVKQCYKKCYTEMIGKGILTIGIGMIFTGIIDYTTKSAGGWIIFGVTLFYGLSIIIKAQKIYNGGIF